MYYEDILFTNEVPLAYEGWNIGSYPLHAHRDVIEILLVVKGKATVMVSCEKFEMDEGDYVVIREKDGHMFTSADSNCELVSLYFNMEEYVEKIPYLYYVIFGCESFDLAKYKNETRKIRRLIASVIMNLISSDTASVTEAKKIAESLLWLLVNDYDMVKYYNRKWDAPFLKVEKYYKIMGYIFNFYYMKNIQEYIASQEFYSKSYITHLFKEVGATSFKDMLDYVRIFQSEELLVVSNLSINDISDQCGFSDVKYYTANFKKWFMCTPSEYRKRAIPEINKKSICYHLDTSLIAERIQSILRVEKDDSRYKAAVNPLSLKVFGSMENALLPEGNQPAPDMINIDKVPQQSIGSKHYLPLRISNEMLNWTDGNLEQYICTYENCYYQPVLIVEWDKQEVAKTKWILNKYFQTYQSNQNCSRIVFIFYYNLADYSEISIMVQELMTEHNCIEIKPILWNQ